MKIWKSTKPHKEGVWVSEIRLKKVSMFRKKKVEKLLELLKEDSIEEVS